MLRDFAERKTNPKSEMTHWQPDIGRESRFLPTPPAFDVPGPRRHIAIIFGVKKIRMVWLPNGEKNWKYVYIFRQNTRMWRTDGQTNGRTDIVQWHRPRLRRALRGKNYKSPWATRWWKSHGHQFWYITSVWQTERQTRRLWLSRALSVEGDKNRWWNHCELYSSALARGRYRLQGYCAHEILVIQQNKHQHMPKYSQPLMPWMIHNTRHVSRTTFSQTLLRYVRLMAWAVRQSSVCL